MSNFLNLESFDASAERVMPATASPATKPGYEEGYAAALQAAEATFAADQAALTQQLVQSIADTAFAYHEAQAHLITAMTPLIEAMVSAVLPKALEPAFHAQLCDLLTAAVQADAATPVTLSVPSAQHELIAAVVADMGATHVAVEVDPDLTEHAAWISSPIQETALDLDAALSAIRDHALSMTAKQTQRNMMEAS